MKPPKNLLIESLHVFNLTSFAIAAPLLERLSRRTVYLEDYGVGSIAILLVVCVLCFLVPAMLVLLEVLAGRLSDRSRDRVHALVMSQLIAAIALPVLKLATFLGGLVQVLLAVVVGVLGLIAYRRFSLARLLVTAASPALLVFPGQFLFYTPITRRLFPPPRPQPVQVGVDNPVPVVLVVFDEFNGTSLMNADHEIDSIRYPNFAALAKDATWFRNATTVHQRTEQAVPAILTGRYPRSDLQPTFSDHPESLFTMLLSTKSYGLTLFEPFTRLSPPDPAYNPEPSRSLFQQISDLADTLPRVYLDHLLPSDLPFPLPDIPVAWYGIRVRPIVSQDTKLDILLDGWNFERGRQFKHFVQAIGPSEKPQLYFSHLVAPHFPWCYLPSGGRYVHDDGLSWQLFGRAGGDEEMWGSDDWVVAQAYQRYLLQVGYIDHLIGELVDRLKDLDIYDRCLLLVMGDHGVSFVPNHSRRAPADDTLPDIMSVPLFIKTPNQPRGEISDRNVESIDVLPTIVDVLGVRGAFAMDGHSLIDTTQPDRGEKVLYCDTGRVTADPAFQAKYETLQRMLETFGSGADRDGLFHIGPHHELVGQALDDLEIADGPVVEIELAPPRAWSSTIAESLVPCYFEGRVGKSRDSQLPVSLAVSVNGTIQAVTRTYLDKSVESIWTALVPEASVQGGEADVRFFVVSAAGGKLKLHPTQTRVMRRAGPPRIRPNSDVPKTPHSVERRAEAGPLTLSRLGPRSWMFRGQLAESETGAT